MGTSEPNYTPMAVAAASLHELFIAFVDKGFTEEQALTLIAKMAAETMGKGEDE